MPAYVYWSIYSDGLWSTHGLYNMIVLTILEQKAYTFRGVIGQREVNLLSLFKQYPNQIEDKLLLGVIDLKLLERLYPFMKFPCISMGYSFQQVQKIIYRDTGL